MQQIVNSKYAELFNTDKRYVLLMGGRGAGRSTVASQYANAKLISDDYFRCAIMRYILGDIRNSIYREIIDRAEENDIKSKIRVNDTTMTISYGTNTINAVGFRKSSGEQKAKLKSLANYNCVIIEEADEISEEDFIQLDDSLRTVKSDIRIMLMLNAPPRSHWIIKRWFDLDATEVQDFYIPKLKETATDTLFIRTSYLDNIVNLAPQSVLKYEEYKATKPNHYWNMIKGYVPEVLVGKIYSNWQEIAFVPHEARLVRRGLDFGYSSDPAAVTAIYEYNGGYIFDEEVYSTGLSNKSLADIILSQPENPKVLVIADSAEPKSIDEIATYGVNVIGAEKGADSITYGISWVQAQKISYTARSKNLKREYENYCWMINKDGDQLSTPKSTANHALDSIRYALVSIKPVVKRQDDYIYEEDTPLYSSIGL